MNERRVERERAARLAAALDELLADPASPPTGLEPEGEALLPTAQRLARLPALLGPASPGLLPEPGHLVRRVRAALPDGAGPGATRAGRRPVPRWRWAAAALAVALVVALLLTPVGQTAVASFLGIFHLGRTEVQISQTGTPVPAGHTAVRETWTLAEARERLPFALPEPAYLPDGYRPRAVYSYTYPDLPEWVPQPVFVDVDYGKVERSETEGNLILRVYPIMLGHEASISRLNLETTSVEKVQDLEINGQPGVLLRVGDAWQEIVWEQGDLVLALWAPDLPEEELLAIARSVR
ncbi:MAG: DUF4367 domain-containing protein [Anaerolineaceae bacterium]|nr:DUF4367 domain-containing protein [Anaerolineaceae bacterium]